MNLKEMGRFEVYIDESGKHRWRYVARNGNIIAVSSEGYTNYLGCRAGLMLMQSTTFDTPIIDLRPQVEQKEKRNEQNKSR